MSDTFYSVLSKEAYRVSKGTDAERDRFRALLDEAFMSGKLSFNSMTRLEGIALRYADQKEDEE